MTDAADNREQKYPQAWYAWHPDPEAKVLEGFDSKEEAEKRKADYIAKEVAKWATFKAEDAKATVVEPEVRPGLFQPMTRDEMKAEIDNPTDRRIAIIRSRSVDGQCYRHFALSDRDRDRMLESYYENETARDAYVAFLAARRAPCFVGPGREDAKAEAGLHEVCWEVPLKDLDERRPVYIQPNAAVRDAVTDDDVFTRIRGDNDFVRDCLDIENGVIDKDKKILARYHKIACVPLWLNYGYDIRIVRGRDLAGRIRREQARERREQERE